MPIATPVGSDPRVDSADTILDVVSFWRKSSRNWFTKNRRFDQRFRDRFLSIHEDVAARRFDGWMATAEGALALLILTDQFPRNAFRGTPRMYATDRLARHYAMQALEAGHVDRIQGDLRLFFCLPFAHSENLSDQELSVTVQKEKMGEPWLSHAIGHRDIVRRFGRFPHRNAILGRSTTAEEAEFLSRGGFAG